MFTKGFLQHACKVDLCNFREIQFFIDMTTTRNAIKRNLDCYTNKSFS